MGVPLQSGLSNCFAKNQNLPPDFVGRVKRLHYSVNILTENLYNLLMYSSLSNNAKSETGVNVESKYSQHTRQVTHRKSNEILSIIHVIISIGLFGHCQQLSEFYGI